MRPVLRTGVAVAALCFGIPSAFAQQPSGGSSMHGPEGGHPGGAMHAGAAPRANGSGHMERHMEHGSGMAGGEAHPAEHGGVQPVGSTHREQQHTGAMETSHHATHAAGAGERGPMHEGASGGNRHEENAGINHDENAGGVNHNAGEHAGDRSPREAAHLSSNQRSRFVETIRNEHVSVVDHVSFGVNVGVVVPATYHYYPLPAEIVSFVPEYRGYYFLVADGDILIIDPATREIVDIIPEA
jgi:hypothetical protein